MIILFASLVRLSSGEREAFAGTPHALLKLAVLVWPKPFELIPDVSD